MQNIPGGAEQAGNLGARPPESRTPLSLVTINTRDYCDHKIDKFALDVANDGGRSWGRARTEIRHEGGRSSGLPRLARLQPLDEFAADSLQIAQQWTFGATFDCNLDRAFGAALAVLCLGCGEPR